VKIGHGPATVNGRRVMTVMGASGCESGNLPGLVEAGTLREKECGDGPRYSREAFLLRDRFSFWLVCRSERELRRWLLRGRRSAGKSASVTCLEDVVLVVFSIAEAS
jgi:hypothetical protein